MKLKSLITSLSIGLLMVIAGQSAMAGSHMMKGAMADKNFSFTPAVTTDYIFRGISQSDENAAISAAFDWKHHGWYAGVWASNVDLPASGGNDHGTRHASKIVGYAGLKSMLGPIGYDLGINQNWFPNDRGTNEADYFEYTLTLFHRFNMMFQPLIGVMYAYTDDASLEDDAGEYVKGHINLALGGHLHLDMIVGAVDVDGDKGNPDGYAYTHYEVGLTTKMYGFDWDLRYHDNNEQSSVERVYANDDDLLDDRVVLTVSRRFQF